MKKYLLYYPGAIPSIHWLSGSVLYADGLLAIFPNEAYYDYLIRQHRNALTDTHTEDVNARLNALRYLTDEGLFEPILASEYLDEGYVRACDHELTELLRSDNEKLYNRLLLTAYDRLTSDRVVSNVIESDTYGLLSDFVTDTYRSQIDTAPDAMYRTGLIDQAVWLLLRMVREGFSQRGRQVVPSTDDYDFTNLIFQHSANDIASVRLVLNKCIPIPDSEVAIDTIVSFRKRHTDLLRQFYRSTNEFQVSLLQIDADAELVLLLDQLEQAVMHLADQISHALAADGIRHRRASWSSLLYLNTGFNHRLLDPAEAGASSLNNGPQPTRKRRVRLVNTRVTAFVRQANRIGGLELSQLLEG